MNVQMPLISQSQSKAETRLMTVLEDIVQNIKLESDFSVHHPNYQSIQLPSEVVGKLRTLPQGLQHKYHGLLLSQFIYSTYYNAAEQPSFEESKDTEKESTELDNRSIMGLDLRFYEQLHDSNNGMGYFEPGWSVMGLDGVDRLTACKRGLCLKIERNRHLPVEDHEAVVGDIVAIRKPKNLMKNGFYLAIGNQGHKRHDSAKIHPIGVRVYFNLTASGAVSIMHRLTQQLNQYLIPFCFKVLYNPNEYGRYDSGVLYFDKRGYLDVWPVLSMIYQEHKHQFHSEVPLFTKPLAEGLGLAEEPDQKFSTQESFGMNRCQIISDGLLQAWQEGNHSSKRKLEAIIEQFSRLEIDLQKPYLNANSEDIYSDSRDRS